MNKDNQSGRDIVEETRQRQFPQFIPPQMGSSNVQNAMPGGQQVTGAIGNVAGMVNPTYGAQSPQYGQPMPGPINPGQPASLNRAEFQGLQEMRNTPGGYENMLQQQGVQMTPYGYQPTVPGQVPPFDKPVR
jgi:hypothetical protein